MSPANAATVATKLPGFPDPRGKLFRELGRQNERAFFAANEERHERAFGSAALVTQLADHARRAAPLVRWLAYARG